MFNGSLKKELAARTTEVANYKSLVNALDRSMAVVELSLDGKVIRANSNFLATMGYRTEQIERLSHGDFCSPQLVRTGAYSDFWNDLRAGKFVSGTFQSVTGQRQNVWLEASYDPVLDEEGRVCKVVKYALDVTKQVMAVAEARGKLAATDRAMAIIEFGLDGNVLTANDNFLAVMG